MDKRHRATPSGIHQGDQVLLLQNRQNKLTTRYDPRPFTVVKRKGVSVELARGRARLFRNVSMVKKVIPKTRNSKLVRRPTQGVGDLPKELPSHGNISVENTERCGRPVRKRHVHSYLNDFHFDLEHFVETVFTQIPLSAMFSLVMLPLFSVTPTMPS